MLLQVERMGRTGVGRGLPNILRCVTVAESTGKGNILPRAGIGSVRTFYGPFGRRPPPFSNWYRPFGPFEVYNKNPGPMAKLMNWIPAPIKSFGIMAGTAALLFFVATPLLIIITPPLCLGLWWYGRKLRQIQKDLYDERWGKMGSYHFTSAEDLFGSQLRNNIPEKARNRIFKALVNNESGIAGTLGYGYNEDAFNQLKFTAVESIHQDFKGSTQGFQEEMEISTYGMIDVLNDERIADITVISQRQVSSGKSKMRIEVQSIGPRQVDFVFNGNDDTISDEDVIIEVGRKQ